MGWRHVGIIALFVDAFVAGRDYMYQILAEQLRIPHQTARNIVIKFRQTGQADAQARGGVRRIKIDVEMVEVLLAKLSIKPTVTLKELQELLTVEMPDKPHVSTQAISQKLDGLFYSLKNVRHVPMQWNTPERKVECRLFANWIVANLNMQDFRGRVWF